MKFETAVFGVMRVEIINCKSTLPGLIHITDIASKLKLPYKHMHAWYIACHIVKLCSYL